MRACLTLLIALVVVGTVAAQPKKEIEKEPPSGVAAPPVSRTILSHLQTETGTKDFAQPMKFSEFLELAGDSLKPTGRLVTFAVDDEAFREEMGPDMAIFDAEIRLRNLPAKASVQYLLRQALKQLPAKSALVVRGGRVDIVPLARTAKEYMLNQTFHVDFSDRRLSAALEELSELTGVSVVLDPRVKAKAQTAVTARFHDDVALQDAVRMLTEMAELKMVYLVTGLYITTPEHATVLQKELKQLYEGPAFVPAGGGLGGVGGVGPGMPGLGGPPPDFFPRESPLAPPLPPSKRRLDPAA